MELFKKLNLIYTDDGVCLKIAGFENMVGSETNWAKQKREQREKHKLLSGQCPSNVLQEIDTELDIEIDTDDYRLIDRFKFINLTLNKTSLIRLETSKYDEIFKQKKMYISNIEYLSQNLLTQIKLYQLAIKRLYDNNQAKLLEKVNLSILEKVFGNILKSKKVKNILEYYISSLINELVK